MSKPTVATFYIVRHGETDWNFKKLTQGQIDIPLNETGEKQAREVAKKFKNIKFDLAFSSDLLRAKRTAEIIALEHKLAIQTTKLLRERHFGTMEGKPSEVFFTHLTLLNELSHEERLKHTFNGTVENDEAFVSRILTFLRETAIANPGKTILVGTHSGAFHVLLIHLGVITYKKSDKIRFSNLGYIKLRSDGIDFFIDEIAGVNEVSNRQVQEF